jgi:peptidoglycan/xylan/chitin deacetylase (PgdA/CDA1 family)
VPSVHPFPALNRPALFAITSAAALSMFSAGCHRKQQDTDVASAPPPKPKPTINEIDLKSYHPNEAGAVMILMYHRIRESEADNDLNRKPETFRKDLEELYKRGYRPVNAGEFADNKMDVPIGKTPVVLTFDDSLPTQFNLIRGTDGQPHIDPNCAIGILETFHKDHPDWNTKATFFVLPENQSNGHTSPPPFYDPTTVSDKIEYLIKNGYEIANHTTTHPQMSRLSPDKIQWEIGNAAHSIQQLSPKLKLDVLALPYGRLPHKDHRKYLASGTGGGETYKNKAVFLAAYRPVASPVTFVDKKTAVYQIAPFDPYKIERVLPDVRQADKPGTFEYWLKWFDDNPTQRYVSDGNPNLVAYPKSLAKMVDASAIKKQGKLPYPYTFGSSSGGGSLSVESGSGSSTSARGGGLSVEGGSSSGSRPSGGNLGVESSPRR